MLAPRPTTVPLPPVEVSWYRTPIEPELKRRLHELSDARAFAQTLGFLAQLALWACGAVYCQQHGRPLAALLLSLVYGAQANFLINAMHELGHGHVFKTPALNHAFCRVVSFLGWLHPDLFFSSHLRHHRYTQHGVQGGRALDLENPMPVKISLWDFAGFGFVNVRGFVDIVLVQTLRTALGAFPTGHLGWRKDWEQYLYPQDAKEDRAAPVLWARVLVAGHALIAWAALSRGLWLVPVLVSLGPFFNGWIFFLCNSTQHVGLTPGASDFRLNTRTFYLQNPLLQHWYWSMNYHTEHHMYAAVPCYNLAALHEAIKHDLPPTPEGLVAVWKIIAEDLRHQAEDPTWVEPIALPSEKPCASASADGNGKEPAADQAIAGIRRRGA
jgi:fatty acid desaturase